jgi:signal transduction histidine kinase
MPLGLPNHLAPHSVINAYARASHVVGVVSLIVAFVAVAGVQAAFVELTLWPALVALIPIAVALYLVETRRTNFFALAYLLIGGACLYWYSVTCMTEYSVAARTDSFLLDMPKFALLFVGAGTHPRSMVLWAVGGFIVAEGATALAASQTGSALNLDGATLATLPSIIVAVLIIAFNRRRTVGAQSSFTRATREEQVSAVRYRIEVKAAAIMHDTVLGHLAAIASMQPGALAPELRAQMTRDLEVLIGEEWLLDADLPDAQSQSGWRESAMFAVIDEARDLGLDVEVSGDVSAITRLERDKAQAVALAAKQCLVNVLRHAGVSSAEVVIYGSESEVSVMVIDAGKGFRESETGADRLGLRQSVRQRIEAVEGAVQVWSTPGRGTSVMIRVPARLA